MASETFLDEIALGRYIQGTSFLHRALPGWKALVLSAVAATTFFFQGAATFVLLVLALWGLAARAGLTSRTFWRSLRPVAVLVVFTILAGAFLRYPQWTPEGPALSLTGLHEGGLYAARLVAITLLTTLFFLTTRPAAVVRLGVQVLGPLRFIGVKGQELSLLVHLAYRFVPLLGREVEEMKLGRKARALPEEKRWLQRLKSGFQTLVHIFVGALHRAETTALALEQRRVLESWHDESRSPQGEQELGLGSRLGSWPLMGLMALVGSLLLLDGHLI